MAAGDVEYHDIGPKRDRRSDLRSFPE